MLTDWVTQETLYYKKSFINLFKVFRALVGKTPSGSMFPSVIVLSALQIVVTGIFHIDHAIIDHNKKYNNLTLNYWHDDTGNAVVNVALKTFYVTTKVLVYIKVNIAEDAHDDMFKKELLRTQIDYQKLYDGIYGNVLIRGFMESIIHDIKRQNLTIPIKPVRDFLSTK